MPSLKDALKQLNIPVDDIALKRFSQFQSLLLDWNERINLTAITDDFGIMTKHFLDSLLPLAVFDIPKNARIIDIGTGAGFPGIPLKLARPDLSVTLLDSLNKRIAFLHEVVDNLALDIDTDEKTLCVHGRAEELGHGGEYREMFDVATSRAVASLDILSEFCLPFVKSGGAFLALKSAGSSDELAAAKPIIAELGGKIENEFTAKIPYTDIPRKIVVIRKISPTPQKFPRNMKKIKRNSQFSQ